MLFALHFPAIISSFSLVLRYDAVTSLLMFRSADVDDFPFDAFMLARFSAMPHVDTLIFEPMPLRFC